MIHYSAFIFCSLNRIFNLLSNNNKFGLNKNKYFSEIKKEIRSRKTLISFVVSFIKSKISVQ